jgi:hypothetical protein
MNAQSRLSGDGLLHEAEDTYLAYVCEAFGLERADVASPDHYAGRELDWFADLNEVLHELEGYRGDEARRILTAPSSRFSSDESLLSMLQQGRVAEVRRALKRL